MLSGETLNLARSGAGSNSPAFHVTSPQMEQYFRAVKWAKEYLGGKCVRCGATDNLQFDHIDPAEKTYEISIMFRNMARRHWKSELDKCQLLCAACHIKKTSNEQGVEHGGGLSGKKNCPCELCRARKARYMRQWKATAAVVSTPRVQLEHGGGTQGIRACKCDLCRAKRAEYQSERRRRQKLQG